MVSRCEFIANRCDGTNQHIKTGECLKTLRSDRPYENMNITGVKGLADAEITTLKATSTPGA
ncbi:hypothetical protein [Brasilonema bromeliae]|uniref:Uncharacterized protein n=1 Tax=Brasilonema bromeliae SPC951 TaxID=385972 RepID=A0ABX1PCJ8_9CYAN|nr:hypothetical protein [Brasilonema bromeliae]NMG22200.1 hypothetical protein [Brasilonema bromeliae SPC951]